MDSANNAVLVTNPITSFQLMTENNIEPNTVVAADITISVVKSFMPFFAFFIKSDTANTEYINTNESVNNDV